MPVKVTGIVAPEASTRIEHPLQRHLTNWLSEKFLHVIAAMGEMESLILLLTRRQNLLPG